MNTKPPWFKGINAGIETPSVQRWAGTAVASKARLGIPSSHEDDMLKRTGAWVMTMRSVQEDARQMPGNNKTRAPVARDHVRRFEFE